MSQKSKGKNATEICIMGLGIAPFCPFDVPQGAAKEIVIIVTREMHSIFGYMDLISQNWENAIKICLSGPHKSKGGKMHQNLPIWAQ